MSSLLARTVKSCEGCSRNFLIPIPVSVKLAPKYCTDCQPIFGVPNKPLPDCSHMIDPQHPNEVQMSEVNREYGTDLSSRQRKQLAWLNGFGRELDTRERKAKAMRERVR